MEGLFNYIPAVRLIAEEAALGKKVYKPDMRVFNCDIDIYRTWILQVVIYIYAECLYTVQEPYVLNALSRLYAYIS